LTADAVAMQMKMKTQMAEQWLVRSVNATKMKMMPCRMMMAEAKMEAPRIPRSRCSGTGTPRRTLF